jgi:hypothetical protein
VTTTLGPGGEFGNYTIESLLGRGGMSVVFVAGDRRLGRQVAIKVLSDELAEDESFRTRFIRESQLAASLEHPNIVPVHEAGEQDGHLYIAMRYVRGTDLRTLVAREGPLGSERALALLRPVASALDAAHRRGLVHRDVKPANILVAIDEGEEHPYLSDFGLTKHAAAKSGLTKTGQFMGTVDYVAPEQIRGEEVDGRTDEYSLACVVYQVLTGRVPFDKPADVATMFGHLQDPPPRVTALRPDLPEMIDQVVIRGMAKGREDRYPTCTAMMEALTRAVGLPSAPRDQPSFDPSMVAMEPQPGSAPLLPPAPTQVTPAAPAPSAPPPAAGPSAPPPGRRGGPSGRPLVLAGVVAATAVAIGVVVVVSGGNGEPGPAPTGAVSGPTGPRTFANDAPIDIPDAGIASPYPSTIEVAGVAGAIDGVTVTLEGFGHGFPRDVDLVLVGPQGQTVFLMEGTGGPGEVSGVTLTFDDDAPPMSLDEPLASGTYAPTSEAGDGFGFNGPPPVPDPPHGASLSVFDDTDPNGTWSLFLFDDSGGSSGEIAGGWRLAIEASAAGATGATGSTAGGEAIFADDFSDPSSGWDVFQDATTSGRYTDGEYVLSVVGGFQVTGDLYTATQELSQLGDVRVEATGRLLMARNAVYGLACRASSPTSYYYFLIQGDGTYYIGEATAEAAINFDTGFSPAVLTGLQPNRIAAECVDGPEGVSLRMFVNGVSVNTVIDTEDPLGPGAVGLRAESRNLDMSAAFDDFVVSAPAGS